MGLGRAHALLLAKRGCKVVVNDPGVGGGGEGRRAEQQAGDEQEGVFHGCLHADRGSG